MALRSDALVFFGATGDLAYKKIFPALQSMVKHGALDVPVIGIAKSGWGVEELRERARASIDEHGSFDEAAFSRLAALLRYVDGDYRAPETFAKLRRALGDARHPVHYLAIPPSLFSEVVAALAASGNAAGARIVVEKPFGRDLESARALNRCIHKVFAESDVFRIDHYLGKEAVQNLIVLRFANTFLEPIWNRHFVDHVEITMAESFGVAGRGQFYEETGALRDVVQNHLLQVVGLLAMEVPVAGYAEAIRDERVKVFRAIRPLDPGDLVRGQFRGYREEPGVSAESNVETFAAVRLFIDSWRWTGVPFLIRAGKKLPVTSTEVRVQLRQPPLTSFAGEANYFRFRLGPDVKLALGARVKRPGGELVSEQTELVATHRPEGDEADAYERLLGEAMEGDPILFAREDEVEAAWKVFDGVLKNTLPIPSYEPGTWGPRAADRLATDVGGWH